MELEQEKQNYICYKKVLLFGAGSTGKSSLAKRLQLGEYKGNITHTKDGKSFFI